MTEPLDIFKAPLDAISLIEASAGTGKTYAITGLYLRLIVEQDYRVGNILVVTFTRAATQELKERIRSRLAEARQAFLQGSSNDSFYQELLNRCSELRQGLRRLNNALLAFDEAAVFTIHGFCERVLSDSAFESSMPFETEILADETEVLQQIVEDFWRRRFYNAHPQWAKHVVASNLAPAILQQSIQAHIGKPYLKIAELAEIEGLSEAEPEFEAAFAKARELWQAHREEIIDLLRHSDGLKANIYNKKSMSVWFTAMDTYLDQEDTPDPKRPAKFVNFTTTKLKTSVKKDHTPPLHPFFDVCEVLHAAADRLQTALGRHLLMLRHELLMYCNQELPRRKRGQQQQSYDDLLINLQTALVDPRRGPPLAESIRQRFVAALIDEFQDTDPIQYDIFQRIYQGSKQPVFLVGDPKQAIYSFRGADIFAYLRASEQAGAGYTLDTNWRSDPGLIKAVNTLFAQRPASFLLEQIAFQSVQAADKAHSLLVAGDGSDAPLRFWFIGTREENKRQTKRDANPLIARATAGRIAKLLNQAERGEAYIVEDGNRRHLRGGDIAVLVRNRHQAQLIRDTLLDVNVPSVQHSRDSVFAAWEAAEMERVLRAIAAPRQEELVRAALMTDLFGLSGDALHQLMQQEREWETTLFEFSDYHELWREQGFIQMFRALLKHRDGYRRLLAFRDGERRLTNVLHLAELLQDTSMRERLGMEGLVKWLAEQRQAAREDEEDHRQLRLESDADLVKIVTIHKSKGLEYPLVFCPFLWDAKLRSKDEDIISFHDPDDEFQAVLDMGSESQEQCRPHAMREELAEDLRLTYVALTRAKYRCYTVWGAINDAEKSALAWLLYRPPVVEHGKDPTDANRDYVKQLNDVGLGIGLTQLVDAAEGTIHVAPLPMEELEAYQPSGEQVPKLMARQFSGRAQAGRRFTSFTALQERRSAELPDHDAVPLEKFAPETEERSIFTFPRGARAGSCLHAIFENIDFTVQGSPLTEQVVEQLAHYGFETEWTEVITAMVERVLNTPLDQGTQLKLAEVSQAQRLSELDFMYPFEHLRVEHLKALLNAFGEGREALLETLDFKLLAGFMRGFIDLVFESGGRFYVLDYKSNWLGPRLEDYRPERLAVAMSAGSYHLQYLVYTVAVHRYLRWRWPDYDYERHFGGVFYLFLRGMDPERGGDCGVFADRPPWRLIEALDRYLATGEGIVEHA